MFNNNDYVVHPRAGVCRITDTIEMPLQTHGSKKQAVYYILQPIENISEKIYLPAENAERLIRDIINRDDALIMDDTSCCKRYFICDSTHLFFTELGRKRTYFKRIINYTFISTNVFFPFFFASYMAWSALRINSI